MGDSLANARADFDPVLSARARGTPGPPFRVGTTFVCSGRPGAGSDSFPELPHWSDSSAVPGADVAEGRARWDFTSPILGLPGGQPRVFQASLEPFELCCK